ncbi:MAG: hypothetical protein ABS862_01715 [Carnobacterium inhibens]|uniref:hypothetical protein n=1 Tax=Carnobacterium sp. TaxID=48221 RepID=UPI00331554B7
MEFFENDLKIALIVTLFRHKDLKIEVYSSLKGPYVNIHYKKQIITYSFPDIVRASSFANFLISSYLVDEDFIEIFLNDL